MLKDLNEALIVWGEWIERHVEHSPLGYESATPEARLRELGTKVQARHSPVVPDLLMPREVARIDRAVREAPGEVREVIEAHYVQHEQIGTKRRHYERLDRAHWWLAGYLAGAHWVGQT